MSEKPIKAKPHFYAVCLPGLQEIARNLGYNLVVHGSMNRDLDLIAIPWIDEPKEHLELLEESKNTHLEHIEDEVLNTGKDGARKALSILSAIFAANSWSHNAGIAINASRI
jgi:hypothetical protein